MKGTLSLTKVCLPICTVSIRSTDSSEDWNPVTKEEGLSGTLSPMGVYGASKKFAELAVWEWAEAHPHVEVTTSTCFLRIVQAALFSDLRSSIVNPPYLFGGLTPQHRSLISSKADHSGISTDTLIYGLLFPSGRIIEDVVVYSDVHDIAKLHVKAISASAKPTKDVGRKRLVVASPNVIDWNAAIETIRRERPELKDRLFNGKKAVSPHPFPNFDFERLEEVLGFKKEDFVPFETVRLTSNTSGDL